ncbi:hypothetical protein TVAG_222900 [Trichomonas vaginalis G3]|uniref:Leucine Rich Repeat family protein n=1 Tax=Trichomonas vaginalis (strain ATCC PRA-98 / G3) TaxID=412133 RepID=A2FHY4_TRIV3|nr:GTPase activator protein [Trichomonas vaginalis G3]EAX95493.1 hypothetical protein TVAG_222900 [Trichomonas vaginalis G3]KAI5531074.1 GTPase activator protein [Trichomonas vaginalis G3]|eukprot:XP_001308423.1 hypothetical protein [Trichomonas vaginalis G3]
MATSNSLDASGQFMWDRVAYAYVDRELKPNIEQFDFSTNHVSQNTAGLLSMFLTNEEYCLTSLNLTQCRLTESASCTLFQSLAKSKIKELTLDKNLMTAKCCEELSKALTSNLNIEYLSMEGCDILADSMVTLVKAFPTAKNLKVVRFDNNSMFDRGAIALAEAIKETNITSLSVADNQIWKDGILALLQAITDRGIIEELDVSYNILELQALSQCIERISTLTALNISGCKVDETLIELFFQSIQRSKLQTIIINGLNTNKLPIAWPHVQDTVWNSINFKDLIEAIRNTETLTDVRIGFLESYQLGTLIDTLEHQPSNGQFSKKLTLSMYDFGRTGNCWVATIPYFELQAPCDVFKWASKLGLNVAVRDMPRFIKASKFDGAPVTKVDFSGCNIDNDSLKTLLDGLHQAGIEELDLSGNPFDDNAVEAIISFLGDSPLFSLKIEKSNLSDFGLSKLFSFLRSQDGQCNPINISLSFNGDTNDELATHSCFNELAEVVAQESKLETITMTGPITSIDAGKVIVSLKNNERITSLKLLGTIPDKYKGPSVPPVDYRVMDGYIQMAKNLHIVLTNPGSHCRLHNFEFPLFAQNFLYNDQVLEFWSEVESKLDENARL